MKNRSGVSAVQYLLIAVLVIGGAYLIYSHMKKPTTQVPVGGAKLIITLLGAPTSGKGTVSARAEKDLGYVALSTGHLVREEIAKDSDLGKRFKEFSGAGKLVPDDMIFDLAKDWLLKHTPDGKVIILDGFPRTAIQAALLADLFKADLKDFKFRVVELQIPDEEVVKRSAERLVCENKECHAIYKSSQFTNPEQAKCEKCGGNLIQREDDRPETVRARLAEYAQKNKALTEFFRSMGIEIEAIDATKTPDEVFAQFKALVAK